MSLQRQLFRESALERLSSPEQLDQVLHVTSPKGWIALLAIWAVLAAVGLWSVFGSAPTVEDGRGILIAGGGLKQIESPSTGRLISLDVKVGEPVSAGDVVGTIDKRDLEDQLAELTTRLQEINRQNEALAEFDRREEELQENLAAVDRRRLESTITYSEERIERLQARREFITRLMNEGNMVAIDRERVDDDMQAARQERDEARIELEQLVNRNRSASFQRERERMNRKLKADEIALSVSSLQNRLDRESRITCPYAGRVVEVRAAVQNSLQVGDPIVLIEPADASPGALKAVVYVSAATGKRIQSGMRVEVVPSTVRREEHGSLVGTVNWISSIPTSKSAMMTKLADRDLVEKFSAQFGTPLEMEISLAADPNTPSGYRWTSSEGPPQQISAGTLCNASVTVRRQSPLSLVIPAVRRAVGAD
ncbi:MAG: NHLP bacteriocin system secretion protein [Phycisphaeraceae bacterium]|nr:NHLP bacteriocin system secretion protein [Phycisphaeraceae bacterium]